MKEDYRPPILTQLFLIVGYVILAISLVAGLRLLLTMDWKKPPPPTLAYVVIGVLAGVFHIGLAQLMDCVGRLTHHAQSTDEHLGVIYLTLRSILAKIDEATSQIGETDFFQAMVKKEVVE